MAANQAPGNLRRAFARNLREARIAKGWSQERLADEAGLHRTYVGGIERGERNVSINNIELLAEAVGERASLLLTDDEVLS